MERVDVFLGLGSNLGEREKNLLKAMNLMGLEVGPLRAPLFEMDAAKAVVLEKVMREYGILK